MCRVDFEETKTSVVQNYLVPTYQRTRIVAPLLNKIVLSNIQGENLQTNR